MNESTNDARQTFDPEGDKTSFPQSGLQGGPKISLAPLPLLQHYIRKVPQTFWSETVRNSKTTIIL
jgi:hypothetical protein